MIVDPFPSDDPMTLRLGVAVQENVVPITLFGAGEILITTFSLLQMVTFEAVAVGNGLTNTTRSTDGPAHPLKLGVIWYVTVPDILLVLTGLSVIDPDPLVVTLDGSIGPFMEAVHVTADPPMLVVGKKLNASLLHIC